MADYPLVVPFLVHAPCGCVVAHINAVNQTRAWAVLYGPDADVMKRTHQVKPVNRTTYDTSPRPYRGRCKHLETQP